MDPQALLFDLIRSRIRLFGTDPDPDPCRFKEVMYQKQYFLHLYLIFLVSRSKRAQPKGILR
jgi:hypothetical protein